MPKREKRTEQEVHAMIVTDAKLRLGCADFAPDFTLYEYQRSGQPLGVGAVRFAWKRATKRAGLDGMLVHDIRRTVARNLRRVGVSEGVIMKLCGWDTRSTFDRYNIIDEQDLAQAVAKLNGTVVAQSEGVAA